MVKSYVFRGNSTTPFNNCCLTRDRVYTMYMYLIYTVGETVYKEKALAVPFMYITMR